MGGSGRQRDAGIYRSAGALVDEGVVSEYFHGFDGSGEAGGDRSRHLYGRRDGGVVVGSGDSNTAAAGEGGGQIVAGSSVGLEECDSSGSEDEDNSEDKVLTEAFFRGKNPGRIHKERHSAQISRLLEKRQIGSTWELRRGK